MYSNRGIKSQFVDGPVPFSTLQSEINAGRPVVVVYYWINDPRQRNNSLTGHMAIVHGWKIWDTKAFVHVNDPHPHRDTHSVIAYSEVREAYGGGEWTYTWI